MLQIAEGVNYRPIITIISETVKPFLESFDFDAITKRDINLERYDLGRPMLDKNKASP